MSDLHPSVRATYDSRETGPRYHVTSWLGDRPVAFQHPVDDPFVNHTVTIGWPDLLRGLLHRHLTVTVVVGGDPEVMDDVMELDGNNLVPGRTRQAAHRSHINEVLGRFGGDR
jgi:hypothetical protein